MIITTFNKYLEKHSKKTYLVLCIIIAVIFVFTVGSGDSGCTGDGRLTSYGTMYGRSLPVTDINRKSMQLTLLAAMEGREMPSSSERMELLSRTLEKMRLVREAGELDLDTVTDEDVATFVAAMPYWRTSDKDRTGNDLDGTETHFTQKRLETFMTQVVRNRFGLTGADFDEMVRDEIQARRVLEKATEPVTADDAAVRMIASESKVKQAFYPFNLEGDTRPAAAAIDAFLKTRAGELTEQDTMANFFLVAYQTPDGIADDCDRKIALKAARVTDEEVKAAFDKAAATTYKDKKLEDVKTAIARELKLGKAAPVLKAAVTSFTAAMAKPLPGKTTMYAAFRKAAEDAGLRIAEQNGLPEGQFVAGLEFGQKALSDAIRGMKETDKVTAALSLEGENGPAGQAVAVKVIHPNRETTKRNAAADILRGELAQKRFEEEVVKVYAPKLTSVKSISEFIQAETKPTAAEDMTVPASYIDMIAKMETATQLAYTFFKEENGVVTVPVPEKRDARLLNWYKREVAAAAALKRATDARAAFAAALSSGKTLEQADPQAKFTEVKNPLSWNKAMTSAMQMVYQQMMMSQGRMDPEMMRNIQSWGINMAATQAGLPVRNFPELIVALDKAGDKALLDKPVPGSNGYYLIYQVSRALPTSEEGVKQTDEARAIVLNKMKTQAINALKLRLFNESRTQLADGLTMDAP